MKAQQTLLKKQLPCAITFLYFQEERIDIECCFFFLKDNSHLLYSFFFITALLGYIIHIP